MTNAAAATPAPESPKAWRESDDVFHSRLCTNPSNDLVVNIRERLADGGGGGGGGNPPWDPDLATFFAIACGWSYGDGQTLADVLYRCGFEGTGRRVSVTAGALFVDTDAFVLQDKAFTAIVFRGTEIGDSKITDMLSDFYSQPVPFWNDPTAGTVHAGFQLAYLPIHDRLVDLLRAESTDTPLFIAGHSLGGALAVVCAAALHRTEPALFANLRAAYTYGQPMVGDDRFATTCKAFAGRTFRHVYHHDLVPQLPPSWTTDALTHFGTELRGRDGEGWTPSRRSVRQVRTAVVPLAIAAGVFVAKQVRGLKKLAGVIPYSLDDHRPQAYITCSKASSHMTDVVFP
jgi:hypothetical protein